MAELIRQRQIRIKETCAIVTAEERFLELAERTIAAARSDVEAAIAAQPRFLTSLEPLPIDMAAPPLARRMAAAAALAGVGPMAAVAGAIAQATVEALVAAGARHVIVDNGGDLVMRIDRPVQVGIFTGPARVRGIALRCEPRPGIFAVCTSSGTVGHSLSFGRADAATVVAASGCLADATATALGNRVREASGPAVEQAIRDTLADGIEGLLVVAGDQLGVGGTLPPLVRAAVDPQRISRG
ncbi:MAG: UPF0280 family protein [Acidobacteria bacterium]|jgi:hypothetical protein|nr:UPF0280 family protein [Acidobacteriota bacterium]